MAALGGNGSPVRARRHAHLSIESTGSGANLVLLHGWGCGARIWDDIASALAARYRVHAVYLPGYGSSPAERASSIECMADALAASLPPDCLVCGWSLGAQVALGWAHRAPRQVRRLALIAATPCFVKREDWPHATAREVFDDFSHLLAADHRRALNRFATLQALGGANAQAVTARLSASFDAGGVPHARVLADGLALLAASDLRPRLPEIGQPVLVLHGDADRVAPPAAAEYLARTLPAATLYIMRGAAHVPFVSHPRDTVAQLETFFDGQ